MNRNKKWVLSLFPVAIFSLFLYFLPTFFYTTPLPPSSPSPPLVFVESKLRSVLSARKTTTARLAYLISGSAGDSKMLKRTLQALYHPINAYIIHLDMEASSAEGQELFDYVGNHAVFTAVGNVWMIPRANLVTYRGPSMVANTLHAAAILLRDGGDWDWFINLGASDYPLVTQDDLLYVFSSMPRNLNFIDHTSDLGWKEDHRAKPIIIDPGLYMLKKEDVFWIPERRHVPTAFKLFTGSAWMALTRSFIEYCIWGWDNLPRTVLMYHANFISSPESYFHTVICNAPEFCNNTVNTDLHFIAWDNPPRQHPRHLTMMDLLPMMNSNAPFARKFSNTGDDGLHDWIDKHLLFRGPGMLVPGGWCSGWGRWRPLRTDNATSSSDPCLRVGNLTDLRPGHGAMRLQRLFYRLVFEGSSPPPQCASSHMVDEMESARINANSSAAGGL